jgi:hypothetical protein
MKNISTAVIIGGCTLLFIIAIRSTTQNRHLETQVAAQKELILQKDQLIDSLHSELFHAGTIIGRTELTLDYLNEVNPRAFIQFSQYYDHETE